MERRERWRWRAIYAGVDAEAPRVAEADVAVLAVDGERAIVQNEPKHLAAVAEEPALLPVLRATEVRPREGRLGRGLVIAGGVTLGVGLGLGGAAAFAGARAAAVAREGFELQAAAMDMPLDEAMRRRDAELAREYRGWTAAAIGTAVSGGVAVIVGAALVGVGRRPAKSTETALVPVSRSERASRPGTRCGSGRRPRGRRARVRRRAARSPAA